MNTWKRVSAMLLALLTAVGCLSGAAAAAQPELEAAQIGEERLQGWSLPSTYRRADDELVTAIVLLEGQAAAEVSEPQRAAAATRLAKQHSGLRRALRKSGVAFTERYDYTTLLNGMAITVAYGALEKIAAMDGVASVHIANEYDPPETVKMTSANEMTGADLLQESGYPGSGTVIAVLDTGITPQHEAFAVYDGTLESASLGEAAAQAAIEGLGYGTYLSDKLPFSYDYADEDDDATDDASGHGTHVSAIAAGFARTEDGEVRFRGSAPDAQILAMKVFSSHGGGTNSAIYFKALEDAYLLGADVINLSLGAQSGFTYDADLETELYGNVFQTLANQGVALIVAAGNEGSQADGATNHAGAGYVTADYLDYGTVASPSTYAGSLSVASAENAEYPSFRILAGDREISYADSTGNSFFNTFAGVDALEYAVVPGVGTEEDFAGLMVQGRVALIARGEISFQEKANHAAAAGAAAVVVYNTEDELLYMSLENRDLPAIAVSHTDGEYLISLAETVQPPEEELNFGTVFTHSESPWYDELHVLLFSAFDAAISTTQEDGRIAALPMTVEVSQKEDWDGTPIEIKTVTADPDAAGYLITASEDWQTYLYSAQSGYLTAAEDGKLLFSDEPTEYSAWEFVSVFAEDTEDQPPIGWYVCTSTEDEAARRYLKYTDGGVALAPLDDEESQRYLISFFRENGSGEPVCPPVATDVGSLRVSDTPITVKSETGRQMSAFSSWGTTPDLQFKPQLTAIGGNVYSAGFGTEKGYELMSGTSMATPDLAGCVAGLLQYLKENHPEVERKHRAELAIALLESSAAILTDADGAAYSPRKQGAGLVDLEAATKLKAYISQPLLALGDSADGVFRITFTVKSLGEAVRFQIDATAMTDKLLELEGSLYNSLQAESLTAEDFTVTTDAPENIVAVPANGAVDVTVTLRLSSSAKARFEASFPNGNFIEGYVALTDVDQRQTPPIGDFRFDDVKDENRFYYRPVYWAYEHTPQITAGTSKTAFSPNAGASRAQVVTFLWRAAGCPEPKAADNPFTDVPNGVYYTKPVLWAVEQGITAGTSQTTFAPNKSCSRAEFVTFLYRYAGSLAVGTGENPFADVTEGQYYFKPVMWAVENGVTAGTSPTTFSPSKKCTRGEIVTFLYRYLGTSGGKDSPTIHASYLGFYGDWSKAPILEGYDWRDVIDALHSANETGVLDLGAAEVNTGVNMAFALNRGLLEFFGSLYGTYAGDNLMGSVPYNDAHIAIASTGTFDALYAAPMLLRNARRVIMTVRDEQTNELVYAEEQEYVPKAIYSPETGTWVSTGAFLYGGTDMDGGYLPDGARLRLDFYASLDFGADALGTLSYDELAEKGAAYHVWSLPLRIDNTAPTIDAVEYDPAAKTLTVTASDEQYLQGVRLLRSIQTEDEYGNVEENMELVEQLAFSDETEQVLHRVVFEHVEAGNYAVGVYDYAGNSSVVRVVPGAGEFVRVTLHCADGSTLPDGISVILAVPGTSISLPSATTWELPGSTFVGWLPEPIDGALTEEELEASGLISEGGQFTVMADADLYAVYQQERMDPHVLLQQVQGYRYEWEGTYAIGGFDRMDPTQTFFLNDALAAVRLETELDEETGSSALRGAEDALLFDVTEETEPDTGWIFYTIRYRSTGAYLTNENGSLAFSEEASDNARWNLFYEEEEQIVAVMTPDDAYLLVYDQSEGVFRLVSAEDYETERNSLSFYAPVPYDHVYRTELP